MLFTPNSAWAHFALLSFDSILITSCIWCSPLQHSQQTTSCSFLLCVMERRHSATQKDNGSNYWATGLPDSITGLPVFNLWLFLKQCKKKNTRSFAFILYHPDPWLLASICIIPRFLMEEGTVLQAGAFIVIPLPAED